MTNYAKTFWATLSALIFTVSPSNADFVHIDDFSLGGFATDQLSSALDGAHRAEQAAGAMSRDVQEARERFVHALRTGQDLQQAAEEFQKRMLETDLWLMSTGVIMGLDSDDPIIAFVQRRAAIDSSARQLAAVPFYNWVREVRYHMGARDDADLILLTPGRFIEALMASEPRGLAYTRARDRAEIFASGVPLSQLFSTEDFTRIAIEDYVVRTDRTSPGSSRFRNPIEHADEIYNLLATKFGEDRLLEAASIVREARINENGIPLNIESLVYPPGGNLPARNLFTPIYTELFTTPEMYATYVGAGFFQGREWLEAYRAGEAYVSELANQYGEARVRDVASLVYSAPKNKVGRLIDGSGDELQYPRWWIEALLGGRKEKLPEAVSVGVLSPNDFEAIEKARTSTRFGVMEGTIEKVESIHGSTYFTLAGSEGRVSIILMEAIPFSQFLDTNLYGPGGAGLEGKTVRVSGRIDSGGEGRWVIRPFRSGSDKIIVLTASQNLEPKQKVDIEENISDEIQSDISTSYFLGREDAPITVIEYAHPVGCEFSLMFHTKPEYCGDWEIRKGDKTTRICGGFNQIKEKFIDTGEVNYTVHDYALTREDLLAIAAIECANENSQWDVREQIQEEVLKTCVTYASSERGISIGESVSWRRFIDNRLPRILRVAGVSGEQYEQCTSQARLERLAEYIGTEMESRSVNAFPQFEIDGVRLKGIGSISELEKFIALHLDDRSAERAVQRPAIEEAPQSQGAERERRKTSEPDNLTVGSKDVESQEQEERYPYISWGVFPCDKLASVSENFAKYWHLERFALGFVSGADAIFNANCPASSLSQIELKSGSWFQEGGALRKLCTGELRYRDALSLLYDIKLRGSQDLEPISSQACLSGEENESIISPAEIDQLSEFSCESINNGGFPPDLLTLWIAGFVSGSNWSLESRCRIAPATFNAGESGRLERFSSYSQFCKTNPQATFTDAAMNYYRDTRDSQGLSSSDIEECAFRIGGSSLEGIPASVEEVTEVDDSNVIPEPAAQQNVEEVAALAKQRMHNYRLRMNGCREEDDLEVKLSCAEQVCAEIGSDPGRDTIIMGECDNLLNDTRFQLESLKRQIAAERTARQNGCAFKFMRMGDKYSWVPLGGTKEREAAIEACSESSERSVYGADMLGLRLGMDRATAEKLVSNRLKSRLVAIMDDPRPFDDAVLMWNSDGSEGIALFGFHNPEVQLIGGMSRRLIFQNFVPTKDSLLVGLKRKYGENLWHDGELTYLWSLAGHDLIRRCATHNCRMLAKSLVPVKGWSREWPTNGGNDRAERLPLMMSPVVGKQTLLEFSDLGPILAVRFSSPGLLDDVAFVLFDPAWLAEQPDFYFEAGSDGDSEVEKVIDF